MDDIIHMDPIVKQVLLAQATALIGIVGWISKQPNATLEAMQGVATPLSGLPIILKYVGEPELGEVLANSLSESIARFHASPCRHAQANSFAQLPDRPRHGAKSCAQLTMAQCL